ncbi:hypothetical protein CWE23_00340 [Idiomarina aquatica]|uniref:Uncharacterized protein n=1 Tax=Idiomarina aquatica TaxID=1327752 RepID=A0AA94EFW6_9GAMM|nr:hypothetical protein CWE23_00340 [Idiomarina aquatica]
MSFTMISIEWREQRATSDIAPKMRCFRLKFSFKRALYLHVVAINTRVAQTVREQRFAGELCDTARFHRFNKTRIKMDKRINHG